MLLFCSQWVYVCRLLLPSSPYPQWLIDCCPTLSSSLFVCRCLTLQPRCSSSSLFVCRRGEQTALAFQQPSLRPTWLVKSVMFLTSSWSCLHRCHIYSWRLPMSWILGLSILLFICRVYIYVRLITPSYLFFCTYFNAWYIRCCPKWEKALEFILYYSIE